MHVYGYLIRLPENKRELPLPWFCRAPLGLKSGTSVYLALADGMPAEGRPARPPDIIVTVLNPDTWKNTCIVRVTCDDRHGLLQTVLSEIRELNTDQDHINIVIGETATLTGHSRIAPFDGAPTPTSADLDTSAFAGRTHDICLFCELLTPRARQLLLDWRHRKNVEKASLNWRYSVEPLPPADDEPRPFGSSTLHRGVAALNVSWREVLESHLERTGQAEMHKEFDFDCAVVTADLHARAVRFVFPRRGARRVASRHVDRPNVVVGIAQVISDSGYNILCSHLRKSDSRFGILEAVCEPIRADVKLETQSFSQFMERQSAVVSIDVAGPMPYQDSLFSPLPPREVLGRRIAQMDSARQARIVRDLLQMLADQWRRTRRTLEPDGDDHELALQLWRTGSQALRIEPHFDIERGIADFHARYGATPVLYLSTGCDGRRVEDEDHFIRMVVELFQERGVEFAVYDADREPDGSRNIAALTLARWGIFACPARTDDKDRPQRTLTTLGAAAMFHALNATGHSLLMVDVNGALASLATRVDGKSRHRDVRVYQWTPRSMDLHDAAWRAEVIHRQHPFTILTNWLKHHLPA